MPSVSAPLLWDDSYATGVREIDEQHMILVHTLNEASKQLGYDSGIEQLRQITQDLLSYALYHFETEEELMQQYDYREASETDAQRHLEQHRAFSARVVAVHESLKLGTPISAAELIDFLNHWLVNHILNTDKKLGAFILNERAKA